MTWCYGCVKLINEETEAQQVRLTAQLTSGGTQAKIQDAQMVSKCELAAPTAPVLTITSPRKKERGSRKAKVSPNNVYIYTTCKNLAPWSFLVSEEAGKHSSVLPEER
jgi:hypothetical protein